MLAIIPPGSVAVTVTVLTPLVEGVPEIVEGATKLSPAGRPVYRQHQAVGRLGIGEHPRQRQRVANTHRGRLGRHGIIYCGRGVGRRGATGRQPVVGKLGGGSALGSTQGDDRVIRVQTQRVGTRCVVGSISLTTEKLTGLPSRRA